MNSTAIHVENLGKLYHLGQLQKYKALRDTLSEKLYAPVRWVSGLRSSVFGPPTPDTQNPTPNTLWAIKDISFDVKPGEAVGIIGRNGAGKSTLLKILSRITEPTEGRAVIHGRIGSLLEVGTGFHPELTGRENIFLNGAILGMKRTEILAKFDEIVAFAEVERFIDTAIKHFSSGMYVRLAFAVAAHLEPEILLIDEVLAVGDAAFQRKCLGKMGDVARAGRTVLFVSHNMAAVNNLCQRGIVIEAGQVAFQGDAEGAVRFYTEEMREKGGANGDRGFVTFERNDQLPAQILKASILDASGQVNETIQYQDPFELQLTIVVNQPSKTHFSAIYLTDITGNNVLLTTDEDLGPSYISKMDRGSCEYKIRMPEKILKPGRYYISLVVRNKESDIKDKHENILMLNIEDHKSWRAQHNGYRGNTVVAPEISWTGLSNH